MEWKDLGKVVADSAPALGTLLLGPAGTVVGSIIAGVFGTEPEPGAVAEAIKRDPQAAVKLAEIQAQVETRKAELAVEAVRAELAAQTAALAEVNSTMRSEMQAAVAGAGMWRTGWRPAFGWVMAASFGWVMFAIGMLLISEPDKAGDAVQGVAAMGGIWTVGLSVLGVAVWRRSDDKAIAADPSKLGVLGAVAKRIAGG